jgi:hypothetical protein
VDKKGAKLLIDYVSGVMLPWMRIVGTACWKKLSEDGISLDSLERADIYNKI